MYRNLTKDDIAMIVKIYPIEGEVEKIDISNIREFLEKPNLPKLINILLNPNNDKDLKKAVMNSLKGAINYTSVKEYLKDTQKNRIILRNFLNDIPITPIYNEEELKAIVTYVKDKSKNTNLLSNKQKDDVESFFASMEIPAEFSGSGFNDYIWSKDEPGADGRLFSNTKNEVIVYLRYGTGSGGNQNDRWRGMFSTAKNNRNRKFLFIVDGPEAILQYSQWYKSYNEVHGKNGNYKFENALWATVKQLDYIDFENFKFVDIKK